MRPKGLGRLPDRLDGEVVRAGGGGGPIEGLERTKSRGEDTRSIARRANGEKRLEQDACGYGSIVKVSEA